MSIKLTVVDIEACRGLLSEPERFCSGLRLNKARRINNGKVRLQSLGAELALSYALSGKALLPPVYRYEKSGRPVTENGFISLSHSGRYAVCALSDRPVGVDIEMLREVSPRLKRRLLTESELAEFEAGADEYYLLRKFVLKEAFLKLTGKGLGGGLDRIFEEGNTVFFDSEPAGHVTRFELPGAIGCLVSELDEAPLTELIYDGMFLSG